MGTYMYLRLKDKSEKNIKKVNHELAKHKIYDGETHNGVYYGAFTSREQLKEDARFMNEDPEGLRQAPGMSRPVTPNELSKIFWNEIGAFIIKLSGGATSNKALGEALDVVNYCSDNNLIDEENSRYWSRNEIMGYMG